LRALGPPGKLLGQMLGGIWRAQKLFHNYFRRVVLVTFSGF